MDKVRIKSLTMKLMKKHEVFLFKPYMVNIIRENPGNPWIKYNLFKKTKPILCGFQPKNRYLPNSKPIQSQFKANFLALFNYKNISVYSVISVVKDLVSIRVNSWLNHKPYLKKQTQFYAVFSPKTTIYQIQTQFLSADLSAVALAKADKPNFLSSVF